MVYTQLRANLDQIWQILVGANKVTSKKLFEGSYIRNLCS